MNAPVFQFRPTRLAKARFQRERRIRRKVVFAWKAHTEGSGEQCLLKNMELANSSALKSVINFTGPLPVFGEEDPSTFSSFLSSHW